jgi:hypothetical protein
MIIQPPECTRPIFRAQERYIVASHLAAGLSFRLTPAGPAFQRSNAGSVALGCWCQTDQQCYFLARRAELLRRLECNNAPETISAQEIGTVRLDLTNFLKVVTRDRFDRGVSHQGQFQAFSLESVKRLILTKVPR